MVLRIPKSDGLLELDESELIRLQSTPAGRTVLSCTPPDELRTLKKFDPRRNPHPSTADSMVNTTFKTPSTIPSWYSYYSLPSPQNIYPLGLYTCILELGSGLNGHPHKLHGGALSLILDEAMGRASRHHCTDGTVAFTATMTVDYKKTISTPGELVCKAWLEGRSDGRKQWTRAIVEQNGELVAEGSALFLEVPIPASYVQIQARL